MPHEGAKSQLTPERWLAIRDLLAEAIEIPERERSAFLTGACGEHTELRSQVEELLRAHEASGAAYLDHSPHLSASFSPSPILGTRIGAYRIEAEIARGGMGTVYRAMRADDAYSKQVAIKLVDRGMLSRRSAELFRHERQILAGLEHPNIARLLDGGKTDDGSPYLVMEYVEGETITKYCDGHQLEIEERLRLFQKICSAVHFAHQNLVIHRDIKPANILVTADGEPKLLDFGIAKVIEAGESQTQTFAAMTPAYASPEQLNGQIVTTATDIYSLGLVLYELLTGRYAYEQFTSPARRQQAILDEDPERPSQVVLRDPEKPEQSASFRQIIGQRRLRAEKLSKRLAGDLESIVAKAIRKEPEQRYTSVAQFSEDISRHLCGETVIAHRSTLLYRGTKFLRRHKLGFAMGLLMFVLIVTGVLMIVRAERRARMEQALAERRFNDVRKIANSLMFEVHDAIRDLPGATPARKLVVTKALEYLDSLSRDATNDKGLQRELAAAYQRVGDAQGGFIDANLGDERGAAQSYAKAVQLRESLVNSDPHNTQLEIELARTYDRLGLLAEDARNYPEALRQYQKSLDIMDRVAPVSSDPLTLNQFAGVHFFLAKALRETGDLSGAVQHQSMAASIRESIKTTDATNRFYTRMRLAGDYASLADLLVVEKDYDRALHAQSNAANIMSELVRANSQNATAKKYLAGANFGIGRIYEAAGNRREARGAFQFATVTFEEVLRSDPSNYLAEQELATLYSQFGELEVETGSPDTGFAHLRKSISILEKEEINHPEQRNISALTASAYQQMGHAFSFLAQRTRDRSESLQQWRAARPWLEQSAHIWRTLQAQNALVFEERDEPAIADRALAECNAALAKLERQTSNEAFSQSR